MEEKENNRTFYSYDKKNLHLNKEVGDKMEGPGLKSNSR